MNDPYGMPSKEAQAAREKTAVIMAALNSGEPGAADKAMGKKGAAPGGEASRPKLDKSKSSSGWLKSKLGKLKDPKSSEDKVIR